MLVENWTKWRLYVNSSREEESADKVIYGRSKAQVPMQKVGEIISRSNDWGI